MTGEGTLHGLVFARAAGWLGAPCQRWADAEADGGRATATYGEVLADVDALAAGLVALGLEPGGRVGLVSDNRPRWLRADLAILAAGGVGVPRGVNAPPAEIEVVLAHSGCSQIFLQDPATLDRFAGSLPEGVPLILLEGEAQGALTWEDVIARGQTGPGELPPVAADDLATLVYTSGTTGRPKGVTLTHRNVVSNLSALEDVLPVRPGERFLAVLPSWHMYERVIEYYALVRGAVLSYTDLKNLRRDLREERPHYLASVPRVWESIHDGVRAGLAQRPAPIRTVAGGALRGSLVHRSAVNALRRRTAASVDGPRVGLAGVAIGLAAWPLHALASLIVHRRLGEATGGRLIAAISGGGALPPHIDAFMDAAGVRVLVGYGLTETSPVVAVRRPERNVLGTIGTPLARTEVRLRDPETGDARDGPGPGVLHVRGPQVMRGYWADPEATAAVLSPGGWFDTGDLIRFTGAGDLIFCGRVKDTIVLRSGENVEPEPLEQAALASPLIEQIVVVGQDRKTLGALVWAAEAEVSARLGGDPDPEAVTGLVRAELTHRLGPGGGFRPWERVPRVALLPEPLSIEAGTLTATLKVRRAVVREEHAGRIEALFSGA